MDAKPHPHADLHVARGDVFDPAHHAEALVHVHQADVERLALLGVHDRGGMHGAEPLADAPFQVRGAGHRGDNPGIEHRGAQRGTELVAQFAAFQMLDIGRQRRRLGLPHQPMILRMTRQRW